MTYQIIGVRHEGDKTFGSILFATCNNEMHAKAIVDALNNSDQSVLFYFGYIKDDAEMKNAIIINGTIHELQTLKRKNCKKCSILELCEECNVCKFFFSETKHFEIKKGELE